MKRPTLGKLRVTDYFDQGRVFAKREHSWEIALHSNGTKRPRTGIVESGMIYAEHRLAQMSATRFAKRHNIKLVAVLLACLVLGGCAVTKTGVITEMKQSTHYRVTIKSSMTNMESSYSTDRETYEKLKVGDRTDATTLTWAKPESDTGH